MKKFKWTWPLLVLLLPLLFAACAGGSPAAPSTSEPPAADIAPAAAKPQLIEFYADW